MAEKVRYQTGRSRQRSLLITKLLTVPTLRQAALETGISERTVARWMNDPAFVAELNAAKVEMTANVTSQLRAAASGAVSTLIAVSTNPAYAENARVSAAAKILDNFIKCNTLESIESRLAQLESGQE